MGERRGVATPVGATPPNAELPSADGSLLHVYLSLGDHLGSTSVVLDKASGEVVERAHYQPYGEIESNFRPDRWGAHREHYRFTGKEEDVEVGLTYFGARYYHARIGRWMSPDPLTVHGLGADLNPYAYVGGNVLGAVDPWGLDGIGADGVEEVTVHGPPRGSRERARELAEGRNGLGAAAGSAVKKTLLQALESHPTFMVGVAAARVGATANGDRPTSVAPVARGFANKRLANPFVPVLVRLAVKKLGPSSLTKPNTGEPGEKTGEAVEQFQLQMTIALAAAALGAGGGGAAEAAAGVRGTETVSISVASAGADSAPASVVREIAHGESAQSVVAEAAQLTYESGGLEHAIISTQDGKRLLVQGGAGGISFDGFAVRRVLMHTHPKPTGPSGVDFMMLEHTGQRSSWIYELFGGGLTRFRRP